MSICSMADMQLHSVFEIWPFRYNGLLQECTVSKKKRATSKDALLRAVSALPSPCKLHVDIFEIKNNLKQKSD